MDKKVVGLMVLLCLGFGVEVNARDLRGTGVLEDANILINGVLIEVGITHWEELIEPFAPFGVDLDIESRFTSFSWDWNGLMPPVRMPYHYNLPLGYSTGLEFDSRWRFSGEPPSPSGVRATRDEMVISRVAVSRILEYQRGWEIVGPFGIRFGMTMAEAEALMERALGPDGLMQEVNYRISTSTNVLVVPGLHWRTYGVGYSFNEMTPSQRQALPRDDFSGSNTAWGLGLTFCGVTHELVYMSVTMSGSRRSRV